MQIKFFTKQDVVSNGVRKEPRDLTGVRHLSSHMNLARMGWQFAQDSAEQRRLKQELQQ